ncbi:MAG TPA: hypothetical protein VKE94_13055 [Gemmataceae bacterium]|nr:hypothetical protein [Gemmataceae bacterium]
MNSTNRLLLVLAGTGAWTFSLTTADLRLLVDPASDVWRLPALVASWDDLQGKAHELEQRGANLQRVNLARQAVLAGLRGRQIDVREAIHRFNALSVSLAEHGVGGSARHNSPPTREVATHLLTWVNQARKDAVPRPDKAALDGVAAELERCIEAENKMNALPPGITVADRRGR